MNTIKLMDFLFHFVFIILFVICADHDYKKKQIPDLVVASMWVLFAIVAYEQAGLLAASFGAVFLINSVATAMKRPILGWADVLLLPVFIALIWLLFNGDEIYKLCIAGTVMAAGVYGWVRKQDDVALAPWLCFFYVFCVAVQAPGYYLLGV